MNYLLNRTKRNWIIVSASGLIVLQVFWALYFLFNVPVKPEPLVSILRNVLHLVPFGFLILVFADYFRHYRLKVLQWITLGILVLEALSFTGTFIGHYYLEFPKMIMIAFGVIWIIARMGWVVFLFLPNQKNYPGLVPIRWFSLGFLLFLLPGIVPLLMSIEPTKMFSMHQLVTISYAIPYSFVIWFAVKVGLKENKLAYLND